MQHVPIVHGYSIGNVREQQFDAVVFKAAKVFAAVRMGNLVQVATVHPTSPIHGRPFLRPVRAFPDDIPHRETLILCRRTPTWFVETCKQGTPLTPVFPKLYDVAYDGADDLARNANSNKLQQVTRLKRSQTT